MISLREITSIVAMATGMEPAELTGASQSRRVAQMRGMAFWLAYRHVGLSSTVIGRHFGDRDHATVLSGLKSFEAELKVNPELKAGADRLANIVAWKSYAATDCERDALQIARSIYLDPRRAGMSASMIDIYALAATFLTLWDIALGADEAARLYGRRQELRHLGIINLTDEQAEEADELDRQLAALFAAIDDEMTSLCGEAKEPNQEEHDHGTQH